MSSLQNDSKSRAEFGGVCLPQHLIDTMGPAFKEYKHASELLFHRDGRVYDMGRITRGDVDQHDPYSLTLTLYGEPMRNLIFYAYYNSLYNNKIEENTFSYEKSAFPSTTTQSTSRGKDV